MSPTSLYFQISKELGLEPKAVALPSLETAVELAAKATQGDAEAFKELFRYHRFAPSPMTAEERGIMDVLFDGFRESTPLFK